MAWTQIVDCRISGDGLRFDLVPEASEELVLETYPVGSISLKADGKLYGSGRPFDTSYIRVQHSDFGSVIDFVEKLLAEQPKGAVENVYTLWVPGVSLQLNAELSQAQLAGLARIGSSLGVTMHVEE